MNTSISPPPHDQSHADILDPSNVDAERALLGSMLMDRDAIIHVAPIISDDDFYFPQHAAIYREILALYNERRPADLVLLYDEMQRNGTTEACGGIGYVAGLLMAEMTAVHANYYADVVREMALRRRHMTLGGNVARLAIDTSEPIGSVLKAVNDVVHAASLEYISDDYIDIGVSLDRTMDQLHSDLPRRAIKTGYANLDEWIGGFLPGQLVLVGARPGVGKTAFAVGLLHHHCIRRQRAAGLISLEMSPEQITTRLIAIQGQIDMYQMRTGMKDSESQERLATAAGVVSNATGKLTIVERRNADWSVVSAQIRDMAARFGIEMVVIDYVQLMRSGKRSDNRVQEVSEITRGLKLLAMDLKIPVVALAQLNRAVEQRGEESTPRLSDLRESGSLEQDSDVVIFIHRPKTKNDEQSALQDAEFVIAKNREGPIAKVKMLWQPHTAQFRDAFEDARAS